MCACFCFPTLLTNLFTFVAFIAFPFSVDFQQFSSSSFFPSLTHNCLLSSLIWLFFFQIGQVDSSFSYPFQPACFCFFFYSASVDSCNFGAFSAHVCWRTGWLTSLFIFPSFLMCVDMWVHITAAHFLLKQGRIAEWQRGQRLLRGDCAAAFFFLIAETSWRVDLEV